MEIKTDIKESYLSDFEIFSELYGHSFREMRRNAMSEFSRIGFPSHKFEEWKYLNLAPLLTYAFRASNPAMKCELRLEDIRRFKVAGEQAMVFTFVTGKYCA